jgi:hypothetical protein
LGTEAGRLPTRRRKGVKRMKKITIRKTGSIKLTSSAAIYCTCC